MLAKGLLEGKKKKKGKITELFFMNSPALTDGATQ